MKVDLLKKSDSEEKQEKVLMSEQGKKLLKDLYKIRSYSGYEDPLRSKICEILQGLSIPYCIYNGNILGFNHPGAPLFSAHMDMVNTEYYKLAPNETEVTEGMFTIDNKACIRLYRDKEKKRQTSLGADDKNGIWVTLMLLAEGAEINFAFCHSEEVGGTGSQQIISDADCARFIANCKYGIIIDRRNSSDIIGYKNEYCMALDDRLTAFAKENNYGFKPERGSISDADKFSKLLECVNLSCGYYNPHTSTEYTNLNELQNTLDFCRDMIANFNYHSVSEERMQDFKKCAKPYYAATTKVAVTTKDDSDLKKKRGTAKATTTATEKKTQMITTTATTTTMKNIDTDIDEDINLDGILADPAQQSAFIVENYLDDAINEGAIHSPELDAFIVPLFDAIDLKDNKINRKDVLTYFDCSDCDKKIALTQNSIDTLWMSYYDGTVDTSAVPVLGICTSCFKVGNITDQLKYIM